MKSSLLRRCGTLVGHATRVSLTMLTAAVLLTPDTVSAQPPDATVFDETADATPGMVRIASLQDETPDVPETLPEVTVTAPFPRQPLDDDTVLSATATPVSRPQVGSSVTVITEEDIQRRGARTLNEILRTVPALDITSRGGPGQPTSIFTRGTNSSQTKVLLDGIPLNDPSGPSRAFDPSNFLLDNVQRIEVIRGPQSTLYGSDAIGGAINIVTRRGNGPAQIRTTQEGGSFGTYTQSTTLSGGSERFWYSFSGAWFKNDGFSTSSFGTEDDGYENGTLSGRIGTLLTDDLDVDVSWRYIDADADFDGFLADAPRNIDTEAFFLRTQTTYTQLDGLLEHRAGYSLASYKKDDRAGFQAFFDGESHQFDYRASLRTYDDDCFSHTLTGGVDHLREDVLQDTSNAFISFDPTAAQFATGVFAENQFEVADRWFTTAGYRYNDFSRAGHASTYRVTSRLLIPESDTALHGAIGTSFRAPALAEVAAGFGFNTALRPEESFGWEAGAEQQLFDGRVILDATYFRNDLTNLIDFPPATGFTAVNIASALTAGVEASAQVELGPETFLLASYTNTKTQDNSTGNQLLRRPRHKANLSLSQFLSDRQAQVSLNLRFVGDRDDFGVTLDEYFLVNASFWYELSEDVRLFGRVDNITDEQYEDVFGFSSADISAYGGVSITLGGE
jgi:vitamin B12 transporter